MRVCKGLFWTLLNGNGLESHIARGRRIISSGNLKLAEDRRLQEPSTGRVGKWYLENCRSRKLFIQSRNLGTTFVTSLEVSFL